MVIKEYYKTRADGIKLYRSYSDGGKMLQQSMTGDIYAEAIDIENSSNTYIETDDMDISDEEALNIITGGAGA